MISSNPSSTTLRVVALAGHERQRKVAERLRGRYDSPAGRSFDFAWVPIGYDPNARNIAVIDKIIASADLVLIAPRCSTILRGHAFKQARRHSKVVVQLVGAGTGATGLLRAAGAAVDTYARAREAA
jgi:hypothetical protein